MGVAKPSRLSEFISRACRLPKEVAGKVRSLSNSMARERLKTVQAQHKIPYKFLTITFILLLYLPWMISFTYVIPPQTELIYGSNVNSEPFCNVLPTTEEGVTHAVLLNSTPFSLKDDWEMFWYPGWSEYDVNRYAWNDSDGYHFAASSTEYSNIILERRMLIPLANYSELTVSAEFEGISNLTGIYFEVFADGHGALQEEDILPGDIKRVNVTAPLGLARITSDSWLCRIVCLLQIRLTIGAQVKLRSIVISAEFTGKLNRVEFRFKSTDNSNLYENTFLQFADYAPRFILDQNRSESVDHYYPCRKNNVLYLPLGLYEGVFYWNLGNQEQPDPTNSSLWHPNVNFTVSEDTSYEVDIGIFAKKVEFDVSPSVLLRSLSIRFLDEYQYSGSSDIYGSTVYSQVPDYLYIPGEIQSLSIILSTWSSFVPEGGYGWSPNQQFRIDEDITISSTDISRNLLLSVSLPYVSLGGLLFGLGEFVVLTIIVLILAGFLISLQRFLRYSDLRHRLSDSRILPLLLVSAGIFLPWSIQFSQTNGAGFNSISWISWFSMPFMIRWSDLSAIQVLLSVPSWWFATWSFALFLFIPLCYGYLSLASIETEDFNKPFAFSLLVPYLVVLSGLNFSSLSLGTITLGPILILAALPVWLLRLGLRRLGLTS